MSQWTPILTQISVRVKLSKRETMSVAIKWMSQRKFLFELSFYREIQANLATTKWMSEWTPTFGLIQNLINGFSPSFVGFSSNNFFLDEKNMRSLWTWPFFFKFQSSFWDSRFIRLVQKKWNEVETKFKQFQSLAFFSFKKLLLIVANYCFAKKYAIIVNMTLFSQNSVHFFSFQTH